MSLEQAEQPTPMPHGAEAFAGDLAVAREGLTAEPVAEEPSCEADMARSEIYGSFWLSGTEFALSVEAIKEVINAPEEISAVPLSSEHMLGLFNLRGMIVPLLDLRVLLKVPEGDASTARKVAIVENGDHCIGLLFDDTGEVLYGAHGTRITFQANSEGVKDVVVQGLLKLDDGARTVQILDPYEILKIKKVPRIPKENVDRVPGRGLGQRLTCISFELGHTTCAIDLRYVKEVMDVPDVQKSAVTHGHVLGTINLRGYTVPIVDFRGVFGNEEPYGFNPEALKSRKLLIMALPEGLIGLLVYSIDSIIPFFEGEVSEFAKIALPRHDIVNGCLINEHNKIVILLDSNSLMKDPTLVAAARSCQELYPPEHKGAKRGEEEQKSSRRRTFIRFTIEKCFALDIANVSAIIDRPKEYMAPPYALSFVEGIINLRGDLITLINARVLYELEGDESKSQKVLIFKEDDQKYGILVDSVDEIVTANGNNITDMPKINKGGVSRAVSEDLSNCLTSPSFDQNKGPVMILDTKSLIGRCSVTET